MEDKALTQAPTVVQEGDVLCLAAEPLASALGIAAEAAPLERSTLSDSGGTTPGLRIRQTYSDGTLVSASVAGALAELDLRAFGLVPALLQPTSAEPIHLAVEPRGRNVSSKHRRKVTLFVESAFGTVPHVDLTADGGFRPARLTLNPGQSLLWRWPEEEAHVVYQVGRLQAAVCSRSLSRIVTLAFGQPACGATFAVRVRCRMLIEPFVLPPTLGFRRRKRVCQ